MYHCANCLQSMIVLFFIMDIWCIKQCKNIFFKKVVGSFRGLRNEQAAIVFVYVYYRCSGKWEI